MKYCYWEYHDGQFVGGDFVYTTCGGAVDPDKEIPQVCPFCGKEVIEREREE